jgi:hypothetical protein
VALSLLILFGFSNATSAIGFSDSLGRAVQVAPIKSTLKAPGIIRLKLNHDKLQTNFAFQI